MNDRIAEVSLAVQRFILSQDLVNIFWHCNIVEFYGLMAGVVQEF